MITEKDVQELFADFLEQIGEQSLRQKVVSTWVEACEVGGWSSLESLREMPFTLLTETHGIDFVTHTKTVTAGAIALAKTQREHCPELPYKIDDDVLVAGGLLHDVGKMLEFERYSADGEQGFRKSHAGRCARHPISGAILAAKHGLPQEVVNVIACHASEGNGRPQRVETVLVHQADFAAFNPLVMINKGSLIVDG